MVIKVLVRFRGKLVVLVAVTMTVAFSCLTGLFTILQFVLLLTYRCWSYKIFFLCQRYWLLLFINGRLT